MPDEQFENAADILKSLASMDGLEQIAGLADSSLKSSVWNTKKVTAHHAIIPTGEKRENLSADERIIFLTISPGYCLQVYPQLRYEAQKIVAEMEVTKWEAKGRKILEAGWIAFRKAAIPRCPILKRIAIAFRNA